MIIGVNYNTVSVLGASPGDMIDPGVGADWVRVVLRQGPGAAKVVKFCKETRAAGGHILGVVALESLIEGREFDRNISELARIYTSCVDEVQAGNEPDHESPSSWTLSPQRLNELVEAVSGEFGRPVWLGGLVSGQPSYLEEVMKANVSHVAIHPYGQRVDGFPHDGWGHGEITDLVAAYRSYLPKKTKIVVTEFGDPNKDFASEIQRAEYVTRMLQKLYDLKVEAAFVFAYHDDVEGFGLVDADGSPRVSYHSFYALAKYLTPKKVAVTDNSSDIKQLLQEIKIRVVKIEELL